jgi:predicted HicB family RNase H-like nuclease
MDAIAQSKTKKTFPLEIEESLHKALKHKAIESDMSLHAYIIDALVSRVNEETAVYTADGKMEENRGEK